MQSIMKANVSMSKLRVSMKLIYSASEEGWLKDLALFCRMKLQYKNSCIYNYRSQMSKVASECHICEKTLYTKLESFRKHGLVSDHGNNLILKSVREFDKRKYLIYISPEHTNTDIVTLLRFKIIEIEAQKQAYKLSKVEVEGGDPFTKMRRESPFYPTMGMRRIAKYLHISGKEAVKVVRDFERLGLIETYKSRPWFLFKDGGYLKDIPNLYPVHTFQYKGGVYQHEANRYHLLQFPISVRRFSKRQL